MAGFFCYANVQCTRNIRPRDLNSVLKYAWYSLNGTTKELDGCVITNSTGYVDFAVSETNGENYSQFLNLSHILINTSSKNLTIELESELYDLRENFIFAFVDKVEQSNFTRTGTTPRYEVQYVRIHFTIDYWTTLLFHNKHDLTLIGGDIELAHINDIKVVEDNEFNIIPDLSNTLLESEYPVNQFKVNATPISDLNDNVVYLYILSTKPYNLSGFGTTRVSPPVLEIAEEKGWVSPPLYLYYIPLKLAESRFYVPRTVIYANELNTGREAIIQIDGQVVSRLNSISDSSVVGQFVSTLPPYETAISTSSLYITSIQGNVGYIPEGATIGTTNLSVREHDQGVEVLPCVGKLKSTLITASGYGINTLHSMAKEDYRAQSPNFKLSFFPYVHTLLKTNCDRLPIDTRNIFGDNVLKIQDDYSGNGLIYYTYSRLAEEQNKYGILPTNALFAPELIKDTYTRMNAYIDGGQALAHTITQIATGNVAGSVNAIANTAKTSLNIHKTLRDGENGVSIQTSGNDSIVIRYAIQISEPSSVDLVNVNRLMDIYGYNTQLTPNVVLNNHKRKYFNHIKITNTSVDIPINETAKIDIMNMFNNGVWLVSEYMINDSFNETRELGWYIYNGVQDRAIKNYCSIAD